MRVTASLSLDRVADDLTELYDRIKHGDDALLRVIAELELTISQMRGLFILGDAEDGVTLTELAPQMGLSIAAGGRALDGLVRLDLVHRSEDLRDRRVKRLTITDAGRDALARISQARRESVRQFVETLGEPERQQLAEALAAVLAARAEEAGER